MPFRNDKKEGIERTRFLLGLVFSGLGEGHPDSYIVENLMKIGLTVSEAESSVKDAREYFNSMIFRENCDKYTKKNGIPESSFDIDDYIKVFRNCEKEENGLLGTLKRIFG